MLSFTGSLKIWVALEPCDMRKGYDGLAGLVGERFGLETQSGALYVFTNKTRTRLKLLYWDGTGVWVLAKRLEQGRFSWPQPSQAGAKLALAPEALALLVGGIDLKGATLKAWYER